MEKGRKKMIVIVMTARAGRVRAGRDAHGLPLGPHAAFRCAYHVGLRTDAPRRLAPDESRSLEGELLDPDDLSLAEALVHAGGRGRGDAEALCKIVAQQHRPIHHQSQWVCAPTMRQIYHMFLACGLAHLDVFMFPLARRLSGMPHPSGDHREGRLLAWHIRLDEFK
ncbi:hypothetical protein PIB30_045668 [Stylosanthes scabra]|uniref:Uncharacterized protein n=1 Tax=Stylosanthes scabra TaxID=79078 RepID=A0ABU6QFN7_9FABA|nr:hypothetical protein [Stylosanthes scabra]